MLSCSTIDYCIECSYNKDYVLYFHLTNVQLDQYWPNIDIYNCSIVKPEKAGH